MESGVYKIEHIESGKVYVGSSYVIQRRWNRHIRELNSSIHPNKKLQNSWSKHGAQAFEFSVIEYVPNELVLEREQYWMDLLDVVHSGYNIQPYAASPGSIIPNAETREKMAAAKRGVPRSEETRAKISAYQKMRGPLPREAIEKSAESRRGLKRTEECRAKMSAKAKQRLPQSEETRAKRSESMKATLAAKRIAHGG